MSKRQLVTIWITALWGLGFFIAGGVSWIGWAVFGAVLGMLFYITFGWLKRRREEELISREKELISKEKELLSKEKELLSKEKEIEHREEQLKETSYCQSEERRIVLEELVTLEEVKIELYNSEPVLIGFVDNRSNYKLDEIEITGQIHETEKRKTQIDYFVFSTTKDIRSNEKSIIRKVLSEYTHHWPDWPSGWSFSVKITKVGID